MCWTSKSEPECLKVCYKTSYEIANAPAPLHAVLDYSACFLWCYHAAPESESSDGMRCMGKAGLLLTQKVAMPSGVQVLDAVRKISRDCCTQPVSSFRFSQPGFCGASMLLLNLILRMASAASGNLNCFSRRR